MYLVIARLALKVVHTRQATGHGLTQISPFGLIGARETFLCCKSMAWSRYNRGWGM